MKVKVKVKARVKGKDANKKQYYWCFPCREEEERGMFDGYLIYVAEKEFFDYGGMLDDRGIVVPELKKLGFTESSESCFEAPADMSKKEIREKLKALGNFKYHKLFDDWIYEIDR